MSAIIVKDRADREYLIPVSNIAFVERGDTHTDGLSTIVMRADTQPQRILTKETFEQLRNLINCAYVHKAIFFHDADGEVATLRTRERGRRGV